PYIVDMVNATAEGMLPATQQPVLTADDFGNYRLTAVVDGQVLTQHFSLPQTVALDSGTLRITDPYSQYEEIVLSTATVRGNEYVALNGTPTSILAGDVTHIEVVAGDGDNFIDLSRVDRSRFINL